MFRGALEDLKDRYLARLSVFHVLSREQQDMAVLNGRLDAAKAAAAAAHVLPAATVDQALVCGPQPMIEGLEQALADARRAARAQIHVERFTPGVGGRPRPVGAGGRRGPAGRIATVISEGVRTDIPVAAGETIIDAAIRAGRGAAVFVQGRHVLHLPGAAGRRRGCRWR